MTKLHDTHEKPFLSSLSSQDWKRNPVGWSANHLFSLPSFPPGRVHGPERGGLPQAGGITDAQLPGAEVKASLEPRVCHLGLRQVR